MTAGSPGPALARRARAARCLPPLRDGGSLSAHDPWLTPQRPEPSTFLLTDDERHREAQRLRNAGWARWEIVATLVRPGRAA